jgi:hypothetical protein
MIAILGWSFLGLVVAGLLALLVLRARAKSRIREVRQRMQAGLQPASLQEEQLSQLPPPARRYLRRALPPAGPFATGVEVRMDELIKKDKTVPDSPFLRYEIHETLCLGQGMLGEGRSFGGPLLQNAAFWYVQGESGRREALFDLVPLQVPSSPDITKMLCARALYDLVWLPAALLPGSGAKWRPVDDERAEVEVSLDGETMTLRLTVDPEGYLREVFAMRFGSVGTENHRFQPIPYGMLVDRSQTVEGYTLPVEMRGGWWYGTDRYIESIVMKIVDVRFLGTGQDSRGISHAGAVQESARAAGA